jgi:hypothetical protein
MAQHDYSIANQGFPATRADINNVLSAIATNNSGTSAPTTQYAGQFWIDTTSSTWTMYIHDGSDDIQFATIDTSANTVNFIDSELADGSVTNAKLGADAVDGDKIADDSIDSEHYVDGSIDTAHIADSQITTSKINDDAVTTAKINDNAVTNAKLSFNANQYRNIIINGDMSIAQRATSTASISSSDYHTVDRFKFIVDNMGNWTMSQDTDVPSGQGFAKSLKIDCTTADASPASTDRIHLQQIFEGQNLQYLKKGTANAESLTASFWVKANKTGTYIVEIRDMDNSRHISKSYTIDASNTWEKKTITFAGDTSGALDNDNAGSIRFNFWLGGGSTWTSGTLATSWSSFVSANRAVGQVNLADSTSNEWYITGVQLEAGTSASDFEFLPHDVNLQRCQRYYLQWVNDNQQTIAPGAYHTSSDVRMVVSFPTAMRNPPSLISSNVTDCFRFQRDGADDKFNLLKDAGPKNIYSMLVFGNTNLSGTAGHGGWIGTNNSSANLAFDSEL